jgi:hypothetical protein
MRDIERLRLLTSLNAFIMRHWQNQLNLILSLERVDIAFLFIGRVLHVEVVFVAHPDEIDECVAKCTALAIKPARKIEFEGEID